jgi:hypothetical protein
VLSAQASVLTNYQIYQTPYISITSPTPDESVSTGNLTITGISSDNATSDCMVYVGWNGSSPYQPASANGTGGINDYSTWNYTFTPTYHEIVNGTNELDSLLHCSEANPSNSFNSYIQPINVSHSINVTGFNSNFSNFTGTEYYYQDNSSAGYFDPGTSLTSGSDGLNYDSSGITYSSGDSGLDTSSSSGTSSISSGDYNYDDYYNDVNDGSSSSSDDDNNDDNTNDDSSGETDSGSPVVPTPVADDGVFDIGAAGDWGSESGAGKTALNMHQQGVDLAIGLGDYSYQEGAENVKKWWNSQMFPLHGLFKGALGNHDAKDQATYAQLFEQQGGWHYSFNKNHVHFVAINTEGDYGPSSSQYKFIDQDLQAASTNADIDWIVVFLHEPMYTSPSHHDPLTSLRDAYHPLFDKYGVDLVLQGHNHNYQRSFPIMYNTQDPAEPIAFTENNNGVFTDPPGQIYAEVGTAGKSKYSLEGKSQFIAEQFDTDVGFLNVAFPNDKTMNAAFYDNDGNVKDKFTIQKTGSNKPIGVNDVANTEEDTPVAIQVLTNDENQYGLAAAQTLPNPNLQVQVEVVGSGPLHGTVNTGNNGSSTNNNENIITYTPTHDYFGTDSFSYRIEPATGIGPASPPTKVSVSVEPVNDPPVANNDNVTYDQDSSGGTINVLANDVDPDGDPLKVTKVSDTSETTQSNQSTIVNNLDGTVTYTPPSGFAGVDSFSYTVNDGSNATASATVQVTVLPTNSSIAPLPPNSNVTVGNITNGNVNSTNSNVTNINSTIPVSNSTYIPPVQQNNDNNSVTLDQPDTEIVSNISLQNTKQDLPGFNVTKNSYESISNNTRNVPDANTVLNSAIENLNNNGLSESQFQNQTSSILKEQNDGDDISSSNGGIANLEGQYDQATANEMARAAALEAEQALQSRNNDAVVDNSFTKRDSSSRNVTINEQIRSASNNNVVEESESLASSRAREPAADPTIESDISNSQTNQELERQVQSEQARAQASMQDKDENSINEALDSSAKSSTDKTSENSAELGHKDSVKQEEENQQDTESNKVLSSASSENSRSQQAKNSKPNAVATSHSQDVKEESRVVLDGSDSNDKDGDKLRYLWKQVDGPRVKIAHDNDAVASFESPSIPNDKAQLKLQFVLVVSDGEDTDKDTVSVSIRQGASQDSNNNDEKARKTADGHKSTSDNGDGDRDSGGTDSSTKSDDNNNDKKDEKSSDKNSSQNDGDKSDDKSGSQDGDDDAPKENSAKSNDKEENKDKNEQSSDESESDSKSDSS